MKIGELRHRVTIQRPNRVESETSGAKNIVNWVDVNTVWANVQPRTARELTYAAQQQHNVTHIVTMRFTNEVTSDCRLEFKGRILNIVGIINVGECNDELQITAVEKGR